MHLENHANKARRLATAILALAATWPAMPEAAQAQRCQLASLELPVQMSGHRLVTTAAIDGIAVKLAINTSARYNRLTEAAAAQLKLPDRATNLLRTRKTTVGLRLGKLELSAVDFLVGGDDPGADVMGDLGRDLLGRWDTEYDLANGVVRLVSAQGDCVDASMAYWADSSQVSEIDLLPDRYDNPAPLIGRARLNGRTIEVEFSPAYYSWLTLSAARAADITAEQMEPVPGGEPDGLPSWKAQIKTLEIGGERISNSRIEVTDFDPPDGQDLMLGSDFFLSHRIYVSRNQRRIYFTYNGGPTFRWDSTPVQGSGQGKSPSDAAGFARRAMFAFLRQDHAAALSDINRACELEPDAAEHFSQRAEIHLALNQLDQARRDLDQALHIDSLYNPARLHRARMEALTGDPAGSAEDLDVLDRNLAFESNDRLHMGRIYQKLGMYRQAVSQFSHWIAVHRHDALLPQALNERCWARTMLGTDLDQALADCDGAISRHPENASYLDSRGWLHLRRGRDQASQQDFDRALVLKPDQAWTLYGRGIARLRQGEQQGRADIEGARKLLPSIDADVARQGFSLP